MGFPVFSLYSPPKKTGDFVRDLVFYTRGEYFLPRLGPGRWRLPSLRYGAKDGGDEIQVVKNRGSLEFQETKLTYLTFQGSSGSIIDSKVVFFWGGEGSKGTEREVRVQSSTEKKVPTKRGYLVPRLQTNLWSYFEGIQLQIVHCLGWYHTMTPVITQK